MYFICLQDIGYISVILDFLASDTNAQNIHCCSARFLHFQYCPPGSVFDPAIPACAVIENASCIRKRLFFDE